jgi:hypothetical protein
VFGALEQATLALGRKVNSTLYSPAEWAQRIRSDSASMHPALENSGFAGAVK